MNHDAPTICHATGLTRYTNPEDAHKVLDDHARRRAAGDITAVEDDTFQCVYCNGWHLHLNAHHCLTTDKISYPTQQEATAALTKANMAMLLGITHRRERATYRCPHCCQWHLTSHPQHRQDSA